jgi:hypothetical protein
MGEVDCDKRGRMRVKDPFQYTSQDTECEYFEPKIVCLGYGEDERKKYLDMIEHLKQSPIIGKSVKNFVVVPSDTHMRTDRGMAMIMLSDDGLATFEGDSEFKNYNGNNHRFADLLVPISNKIKNPIIFWLARKNPPGCKYILETQPIVHHILQLGRSYSLEGVIICLAKALKYENVRIISPWFFRDVERTIGKNIYEIDKICTEVFFEIEPEIKKVLIEEKKRLRKGTINWFIYKGRCPDLEVVAKIMELDKYIVGRTDARGTILYQKESDKEEQELTFTKFISEEMNPPSVWIIFDIDDTYWGSHWIPLLKHVNNSSFETGGAIVFIKKGLIEKPPFNELVDQNRNLVIELESFE